MESRYCTDKRSKERNHIRNTDDHTDQYGIWHLHDQKNDIADNSDNGRIQYLSADKSAKDLVALSGCLYDNVCPFRFKQCIGQLFELSDKSLFTEQQIY